MESGDFYGSEQSYTMVNPGTLRIEYTSVTGSSFPLRAPVPVQAGEVIDASVLSKQALCQFIAEEVQKARQEGVLFSVHLKATMMKVSDPIIFGHAVEAFFPAAFAEHGLRSRTTVSSGDAPGARRL